MAVQAAADAAELEHVRVTKLGLPGVPDPGFARQQADAAQRAEWQQLEQRARGGLEELGKQLLAAGDGGETSQPQQQDLLATDVARRHLAATSPDDLPFGRLQLVLDDLRLLARERQRQRAARLAAAASAGHEGSGATTASAAAAMLLDEGSCLASAWGVSAAGELRLGDVAGLVAEYKGLVGAGV